MISFIGWWIYEATHGAITASQEIEMLGMVVAELLGAGAMGTACFVCMLAKDWPRKKDN